MKKILIAEGDDILRKIIDITLMNEDFSLLYAADIYQLISMALSEAPDLIVTDTILSEALEVIETLKKSDETAHIPVLLLTDSTEHVDDMYRSTIRGPLLKPFSPMVLLTHIESALMKNDGTGDPSGDDTMDSAGGDHSGSSDDSQDMADYSDDMPQENSDE